MPDDERPALPRDEALTHGPAQTHRPSLTRDADLDGLDLTDEDLTGADARDARLIECALTRCTLDGARLDGARLVDATWTDVRAVTLHLTRSTWRKATWTGCRLGAVQAGGADVARLVVRGGRIDYLNLREAELVDVTFERVVLDELDLARVVARGVRFADCTVRRLDVSGARLTGVDLRGVTGLTHLDGVGGLAGATIDSAQLVELAPLLAAHVGLVVADGTP